MSDLGSQYDSVAAVGILQIDSRLLVIKRSRLVIAPGKLCFPGGRVEEGESVQETLRREFAEETSLVVQPVRELWVSVTSWKCKVHWWVVSSAQVEELAKKIPTPNEKEVESIHWMTVEEMLASEHLLESNRQFMEWVAKTDVDLS